MLTYSDTVISHGARVVRLLTTNMAGLLPKIWALELWTVHTFTEHSLILFRARVEAWVIAELSCVQDLDETGKIKQFCWGSHMPYHRQQWPV